MKQREERVTGARKVYELYWESYLSGDEETFASTLDDAFEMIGTSASEIAHGKAAGLDFVKTQVPEIAGKAELRNRQIKAVPVEGLILFVELADIYLLVNNDWNFYSGIRLSTFLCETEAGWKVVQQHGSFPDNRVQEGETIAFEKISKENIELRDAVKRRTKELENKNRELEIEAALEKVRSSALAMKEPSDMVDVCNVISDQLQLMGIRDIRNVQTAIIHEQKGTYLNYQYFAAYEEGVIEETAYNHHPTVFSMVQEMKKSANSTFSGSMEGEELNTFRQWRKQNNQFPDPLLDEVDSAHYYFYSIGQGGLGLSTYKPISEEGHEIFKRFHIVFTLAYRRFTDIELALAQAREAQIETAVERVRAQSMAMYQTSDLYKVNEEVLNQLYKLKVDGLTGVSIYLVDGNDIVTIWDLSSPGNMCIPNSYSLKYDAKKYPIMGEWVEIWKSSNQDYLVFDFPTEKLIQAVEELKEIHPEMATNFKNAIESGKLLHQWNPAGSLSDGILAIDLMNPPTEDTKSIVTKMASAFNMAYQRFLDLQKAEAQAREAQIEAAMERIRSRALAMRNSTEVGDVSDLLFFELEKMDINPTGFSIMVFDREQDKYELWRAKEVAHQGVYETFSIRAMYDKLDQHIPGFTQELESEWNGGSPFFIAEFSGMKRISFLEANREMGNYTEDQFENVLRIYPDPIFWHLIFFRYGWLGLIHNEQLPAEDLQVIRRFADVFEFAHTRFLDLQKAEAQTREAQIEGSLERVRSKTMAMRNSQDVGDTVAVMFDELVKLGIETVRCGIGILFESMQMEAWTAKSSAEGKATLIIGRLGLNIHPLLQEVYHSWMSGDQSYSYELKGEDLKDYFRAINNSEEYPIQYDIDSLPTSQFQNAFFFSEGALFSFTKEPMEAEASMIFKRFAGVFGQTYTRFLDLQKAESQAKEAIKRSSLDRVRGQIASMRTARDLEHITPIIWQELKTLDVPFIRCGIFFVDNEQSKVNVYLTTPDVKPLGVLSLPIESGTITARAVDHWRKGMVYKDHWNKDQFVRWTQSMLELGQIQNKETYQGSENPPEALDLYFVPFTQGMLYVGNIYPLSEELIQLIKSLADAFSIAYARYEDFNKLEKVKESIEATLTELKSTQAQLIHAEKMASLGELTAGIAHEIQNPLNFVNNFSEVSSELLDELNELIERGDLEEAKSISTDIKQNLEKINHHGKRADAIVKGMLQHSRSSNGVKEPTDVNAMVDEYLRLAYHGLRAKDKDFNATLKTDFDETIGKIEVIPQDIGRVLLNLINNAFYACAERSRSTVSEKNLTGFHTALAGLSGLDEYKPTVIVSTKNFSDRVEISIKDNGNGIPEEIKNKIFQPFFTTKPPGNGTGLGLSLSYDIVKAHSGELKVTSTENKGTTFVLTLPV